MKILIQLTFLLLLVSCDSKKEVILMNQTQFDQIIENVCQRYKNEINQAGKTQTRIDRKKDLSKLSGHFSNWNATIKNISTDSDGNAKLRFYVSVEGRCASIDFISKISPKHNSYSLLTKVNLGQVVKISGVINSDKSSRDYFSEDSLTEMGSILEPEFIVKISKIAN